MRIFVDVDGTLTDKQRARSWFKDNHNTKLIEKLKKLQEEGNEIYIWTGNTDYAKSVADDLLERYGLEVQGAFGKPSIIIDNERDKWGRKLDKLTTIPDDFMETEHNLYGDKFFSRRHKYHDDEIKLANHLYNYFKPNSVYDFGCGIGSYLSRFKQLGCDVGGCDIGYKHAKKYMDKSIVENVTGADLTNSVMLDKTYDLVISTEVAEHLPESAAETFCDSLCKASHKWIWLTAAKSKRGVGHLNPQEKEYWIDIMELCGATYSRKKTLELRKKTGNLMGLRLRMMVFSV